MHDNGFTKGEGGVGKTNISVFILGKLIMLSKYVES